VRKVRTFRAFSTVLLAVGLVLLVSGIAPAKEDVAMPKEPGVYIQTAKVQKRLLPNIVFEEQGVIYLESNNPQRFPLGEVQSFVLYGKYDMQYLTLNPLLFLAQSPLGKARYAFGKDIEIEVSKKSDLLYVVKPKGLFGRGYYTLWINDSAWDFVIE
jgi:hypothetical protein